MTVPSDPRDPRAAHGAYPPVPGPNPPVGGPTPPARPMPPAAVPPSYPVQPPAYAAEPVAVPVAAQAAVPAAVPARTQIAIDTARYWAGVVATAIVAALIGVAGVLVVEQVLDISLVVKDVFRTSSHTAEYAWGGAVAALVAGLVLYLLALAAPRPTRFFGWIMALASIVAAVLPFTWTSTTERAVATGLLNLVMGIAIWSLLAGALAWTSRVRTVV